MLKKKGQSTLEYLLVLTAIIGAIIIAATKFVKPQVEGSLEHVSNEMGKQVDKISF